MRSKPYKLSSLFVFVVLISCFSCAPKIKTYTIIVNNDSNTSRNFESVEIWLNELKFYFDEIIIITEKLENYLEQVEDIELTSTIEELIANLLVQKTITEQMMSDILKHERKMLLLANSNGALQAMINSTHKGKRQAINVFKADYQDLKLEFQDLMERLV